MCKMTQSKLSEHHGLVSNYDLVESFKFPNGSAGAVTTFVGNQAGKAGCVSFLVELPSTYLWQVWVNGKSALSCI